MLRLWVLVTSFLKSCQVKPETNGGDACAPSKLIDPESCFTFRLQIILKCQKRFGDLMGTGSVQSLAGLSIPRSLKYTVELRYYESEGIMVKKIYYPGRCITWQT